MKLKSAIILLIFILINQRIFSQGDTVFNKINENGERAGVWKTYMQPIKGEKYFYEIATYNNGRYDGLVIHFAPNGVKIEESHYRNDTLDGLSKIYSNDGVLRTEQYFKDGRLDGKSKLYSISGRLQEEQEYVEGVETGVYRRFSNSSGRILEESSFVNGVEQGVRRIFEDTEEHKVIREFDFKNGVRISARYYKEGRLFKEESFDYKKGLEELEKLRKANTENR